VYRWTRSPSQYWSVDWTSLSLELTCWLSIVTVKLQWSELRHRSGTASRSSLRLTVQHVGAASVGMANWVSQTMQVIEKVGGLWSGHTTSPWGSEQSSSRSLPLQGGPDARAGLEESRNRLISPAKATRRMGPGMLARGVSPEFGDGDAPAGAWRTDADAPPFEFVEEG
jgi:hypothetical protein